jgi:hypothetical protein
MSQRRTSFWGWLAAGTLGAALIALGAAHAPALAQDTGWTPPRLIYEGLTRVDWPHVIADEYGQVHGLWIVDASQGAEGNQKQIFYTQPTELNSQPVDVLVYNGPATSMDAAALGAGVFVTWNGTGYARSAPGPGVTARDWTSPLALQGLRYFQPGLAQGPDGALWMAYGTQADRSINLQRLEPGGTVWGDPVPVSFAFNTNAAPDWMRLAVSPGGHLHLVWAEYQLPAGFPTLGIYYTQSADGGATWATPREMAPGGYNQANIALGPDQTVLITYVGIAGVGGRYLAESTDNGRTWGPAVTLAEAGGSGSAGAVQMAVDSNGNVHTVYADRGCVWHRARVAGEWSEGQCISQPLPNRALKEYPSMALGLGNELHVLFWTDRQQLWYTRRTLDAPALPPQPLPTTAPATATVPPMTATAAPTATHLPDFGPPPEPGATTQAGVLALAAAVAPVLVFFGGVLLARSLRRR